MKKINYIISACLFASMFLFSSCLNKFLTLLPMNEVVSENYWTDKNDVKSSLMGVYAALESTDCIKRMFLYGESRSDNVIPGNNQSDELKQFSKENILETNDLVKWDCFYKVINLANNLMYYAPEVQKKDPNYSPEELRANIAEAMFLRSLSYFYLIRSFKDVPYVTRPSIDDTEDFRVATTPFDQILDSLINDMESVRDYAYVKFSKKGSDNSGRVTRAAVYALLAELHLWHGDYDECIEYVNKVVERKLTEYNEILDDVKDDRADYIALFNGYPLIPRCQTNSTAANDYRLIFGEGNSFESIFELSFMTQQSTTNGMINDYYASVNQGMGGTTINMGSFAAYTADFNGANRGNKLYGGSTNYYDGDQDGRSYQSVLLNDDGNSYFITKYVWSDMSFRTGSNYSLNSYSMGVRGQGNTPNWIIYRLTDVMLLGAEAQVQKAKMLGDIVANDTLVTDSLKNVYKSESAQLLESAFNAVQAVNDRAINIWAGRPSTSVKRIKPDNFVKDANLMEELVLDERRRELMFEGKRWYDLLRMARRQNTSENLINYIIKKQTSNISAITIRLTDMDALYLPIHKDQIKINPLLHQNKAYETTEYIKKN